MSEILPFSAFNWDTMLGKTLEMVCFAEFTVFLHFEDALLVQFETDFYHGLDLENPPLLCSFPLTDSRLTRIVGSQITSATHVDETLRLVFSNDNQVLISTMGPYEIVQVSHNGRRFVGW